MIISPERIALTDVQRELAHRKLELYAPYPKQREFHRAGGLPGIRERLLMAGNQEGKTLGASAETAMHLTGEYPDWWEGKVFHKPTAFWAASNTGQSTRDNVQRLLLGDVGSWGTGMIPESQILDIKRNPHGVADAVEIILVKHVTRGTSRLTIKSYDQGRLRWQGETLDGVWFDEEPDEEIYSEGKTRTNATWGIAYMTFTPLLGMSAVVKRLTMEKPVGSIVINMTIYDALHYTPEQREAIIAGYPEHEREARAMGRPVLGSGAVYPVVRESIQEVPVGLPAHWPRIVGLDFGYDHPTAAVWVAWDRDADTVHVYDCYRVRLGSPIVHAAAIRVRGPWIPVAWPHDGNMHKDGSEQLAQQYRDQMVNMLPRHATHPPAYGKPEHSGGFDPEASVMDILDRMQTGRFKVAKHLHDWWEEFSLYHRKDGKIVPEGDDLMSATAKAVMMLRKAKLPVDVNRATVAPFRVMDPVMGGLGA